MRAILGRLSDLGVRELFKLLTSVAAEGTLEIESPDGQVRLLVREGHVIGEPEPALVSAYGSRSGTFCFRPGAVGASAGWVPVEELLARLDAQARARAARGAGAVGEVEELAGESGDLLAELRDSLAEVPFPGASARVGVVAADPRPYRPLEVEWRQRGWQPLLRTGPGWPEGEPCAVLVVHLPSSGTLAGQGDAWLELLRRAKGSSPPVPVVWVGGLADPLLRHGAIMAGADFLLPGPAGEVGETARWFREELTLVVERLLSRRDSGGEGEAEALRDFFLALHVDAEPAEIRASLLRFAGGYFRCGLLYAVRDSGFESLGGYGLSGLAATRVPRGVGLLEELVIDRRPIRVRDRSVAEVGALAAALGLRERMEDAQLFPLLVGSECVGAFLGTSPVSPGGEITPLETLLARSGGLIGV